MSSFLYLAVLLVSLAGLTALDWRHRIALFAEPRRALLTVVVGVAFFLVWDLAGIGLGIFFRGDGQYMTGVLLAPELPIEELLFLTLLVYQALLLWRWFERREARKVAR